MDPLADASNRLGALQPSPKISSKRQRLEQLQSQQATFHHVVSAGWILRCMSLLHEVKCCFQFKSNLVFFACCALSTIELICSALCSWHQAA